MSRVLYESEKRITCPYGNGHGGVDLGWRANESQNVVMAHSDGVVVEVVKNISYNTYPNGAHIYGNYVKIRHRSGYYTLYAHLKYGSINVSKGDSVRKDQQIGIEGNTGYSQARHCHFEVRNKNDVKVNPTKYLTQDLPGESTSWTTGKYQLLKSKAIRTDHKIANNIVKVGECMPSVKPKLTKTDPNADAFYKVNTKVNITEIYTENNSRVWGKLEKCWIVLCNKDGTPQAKKI